MNTCVCRHCADEASHVGLFCHRHRKAIPPAIYIAIENRYSPDEKPNATVQHLIRKAIMAAQIKDKEREQ